jgi:regulator of RNase E activity RraB
MGSLENQLESWPTQREQRDQVRDVLAAARPIEHFAYFDQESVAQIVATELRDAGFVVGIGQDGPSTLVKATRDESLTDDNVAAFLAQVIGLVERHGGRYDGWGGPVFLLE